MNLSAVIRRWKNKIESIAEWRGNIFEISVFRALKILSLN